MKQTFAVYFSGDKRMILLLMKKVHLNELKKK